MALELGSDASVVAARVATVVAVPEFVVDIAGMVVVTVEGIAAVAAGVLRVFVVPRVDLQRGCLC